MRAQSRQPGKESMEKLMVGMHEETVINQEAQDHAMACPLCARLLGQLAPAFIRLPVLNKNLYEPPQRVALNNRLYRK